MPAVSGATTPGAGVRRRSQQSNTDQQMALRNRWSSSTSARIAGVYYTLGAENVPGTLQQMTA